MKSKTYFNLNGRNFQRMRIYVRIESKTIEVEKTIYCIPWNSLKHKYRIMSFHN